MLEDFECDGLGELLVTHAMEGRDDLPFDAQARPLRGYYAGMLLHLPKIACMLTLSFKTDRSHPVSHFAGAKPPCPVRRYPPASP